MSIIFGVLDGKSFEDVIAAKFKSEGCSKSMKDLCFVSKGVMRTCRKQGILDTCRLLKNDSAMIDFIKKAHAANESMLALFERVKILAIASLHRSPEGHLIDQIVLHLVNNVAKVSCLDLSYVGQPLISLSSQPFAIPRRDDTNDSVEGFVRLLRLKVIVTDDATWNEDVVVLCDTLRASAVRSNDDAMNEVRRVEIELRSSLRAMISSMLTAFSHLPA